MPSNPPAPPILLKQGSKRALLESLCAGIVLLSVCTAGSLGQPLFSDPVRLANDGGGAISTVAGDFDNDGRAELVSTASRDSSQRHFRIYSYDPAAHGFVAYDILSQAAVAGRQDRFGGDLDVGDMNNDGFLDIIVPESDNADGPGRVSWFENPRGNLGGNWVEHVISTWTGSPGDRVAHMSDIAVGDIDGDGWLDVVTRDVVRGCFVLLRDHTGTGWQTRRFISTNPREGLMLWDPDGDGDLDILINGVWFETPTDPLYGTYIQHTIAASWYPAANGGAAVADYACQVGVADFNRDGRTDVVISNAEELLNDPSTDSKPGGVRLYLAPQDLVNGVWTEVILEPLNYSWHSLEIADIDADGDLDVVSGISLVGVDNAAANIVAFLNDGTGLHFAKKTIDTGKDALNADVNMYNATLADADGDGDFDLFAPDNWNSGPIRYYENTSGPPSTTPPVAPSGLTAGAISMSEIELAWIDESNDENGFKIERSINGGPFVEIAQTGAGITLYSDPDLTPDTVHTYRIRAFNVFGDSEFSPETSAMTPVANLPPAPPGGLAATPVSSDRIDLVWVDESNNESGFKVERSINAGPFAEIAQTGAGVTSLSDSGLTAGTECAYRVRSFNAHGDSDYSSEASASTLPDSTAPVFVSVSSSPDGAVTVVFSESVEEASAESAANYSLSGGAVVNAATLAVDGLTVVLETVGLVNGSSYSLTATGVTDLSPLENQSGTVASFVHVAWLNQDIGSVAVAGSMSISGSTITISGSGADIFSSADGFHFAYRSISGDAEVIARVTSQTRASEYSKAGVMIRETLGSGSKHASIVLTPDHGAEMNYRQSVGGTTGSVVYNPAVTPRVAAPYWVRIVRQGNLLTSSVSADGVAWQQVGSATVSMAPGVFVGLAVTSHNNGTLSTATFENVNVPGRAGGLSAAPTGLIATPVSTTRIDLAWMDESNNESGFRIERSMNSGAFLQVAQTGADVTAFSDSGLTPDTLYAYRVRSFDAYGASGYSLEVSATTPVSDPPPAAPAGLTATPVSMNRIDLAWSDESNNESGFKVERSISPGPFEEITQTGENVTGYSDSDLTPETTYSYRVRAFNADGDSVYTAEASATTPAAPVPPAAPSGLTANAFSTSRVDLTWIPQSANHTGFKIERSIDSSPFVQIAHTARALTAYSDWNLSENMSVSYRVRATNPAGDSEYSPEASAITPADESPPAVQSVSSRADGIVTLVFTEAVDQLSAENAANYVLSGEAVVSSATLAPDGRTVILATSGLIDGTSYTLAAIGVGDLSASQNLSAAVAGFEHAAWLNEDIGNVGVAGNVVITDPAITVAGSGAGIGSNADEFHFVHRAFAGDVAVIARVTSQTRASPSSKAGVMIREALDPGSSHAFMALTPDSGGQLISRSTSGGQTVSVNYDPVVTPPVGPPYWVRIVRQGSSITGSVSIDGVDWQEAGTATVSMAPVVFVGLAVTAGNDGAFSTARFENVRIEAAVPPAAPIGLQAIPASPREMEVAWAGPAGNVTGFRIERRAGPEDFSEVGQVPAFVTSVSDSGLLPGTEYVYRAMAFNDYGESASSAEVTAATPLDPFLDWQHGNFGPDPDSSIAGMLEDPDEDSLVNAFEYFHGTDPNSAEAAGAVQLVEADRLTVSFTRSIAASDVTVTVQGADDLTGEWTDLASSVRGGAFAALLPGVEVSESGEGPIRSVLIGDCCTLADPAHPRRFMRLVLVR